jgi:hypothetical protein
LDVAGNCLSHGRPVASARVLIRGVAFPQPPKVVDAQSKVRGRLGIW